MAQKAARLTASRALPPHWPASAAAQPSPGAAITTTAPVGLWVPHTEGGQSEGLLSISQSREVWVGVSVPECGVRPPRGGGGWESAGEMLRHLLGRFPVPSLQPQASQGSSVNLGLLLCKDEFCNQRHSFIWKIK